MAIKLKMEAFRFDHIFNLSRFFKAFYEIIDILASDSDGGGFLNYE